MCLLVHMFICVQTYHIRLHVSLIQPVEHFITIMNIQAKLNSKIIQLPYYSTVRYYYFHFIQKIEV